MASTRESVHLRVQYSVAEKYPAFTVLLSPDATISTECSWHSLDYINPTGCIYDKKARIILSSFPEGKLVVTGIEGIPVKRCEDCQVHKELIKRISATN